MRWQDARASAHTGWLRSGILHTPLVQLKPSANRVRARIPRHALLHDSNGLRYSRKPLR